MSAKKLSAVVNLERLMEKYSQLGIGQQIDYSKFYLYSIITHSTAIEGSTVTEVENQLLFDEGITAKGRSLVEQTMNLDLKEAYEWGMKNFDRNTEVTVDFLKHLSARVMAHTGSKYSVMAGSFNAAEGDLRLVNVSAGYGGRSYMSYLKVPERLEQFCKELNRRRTTMNPNDLRGIYELSFWAHWVLVSIHPCVTETVGHQDC